MWSRHVRQFGWSFLVVQDFPDFQNIALRRQLEFNETTYWTGSLFKVKHCLGRLRWLCFAWAGYLGGKGCQAQNPGPEEMKNSWHFAVQRFFRFQFKLVCFGGILGLQQECPEFSGSTIGR